MQNGGKKPQKKPKNTRNGQATLALGAGALMQSGALALGGATAKKKLVLRRVWNSNTAEKMRTRGRPKIVIDWKVVRDMLTYGGDITDVSNAFNVSEDSLRKRCALELGMYWDQLQRNCTANLEHTLRKALIHEAIGYTWEKETRETVVIDGTPHEKVKVEQMYHAPNVAAQIFVAKNYLGLKDEPDTGGGFGELAPYRFVGDDDATGEGEAGPGLSALGATAGELPGGVWSGDDDELTALTAEELDALGVTLDAGTEGEESDVPIAPDEL